MSIKENIADIEEKIAAAAKRAGRDPKEITLHCGYKNSRFAENTRGD